MKRSPRKPRKLLALTLGGSAALAMTSALAFAPMAAAQDAPATVSGIPEPDLVTEAWQFTFTHSQPRTISVENAQGEVQWYWYFTYKVVNNEQEDLLFTPEIIVADDQGRIVHANRGVNITVFRAVRDLVRNPLLMSPAEVNGRMFPGEDFARESVAIWPVSADDVDEFAVFFGGLYGEIKPVLNPVTGEPIEVQMVDPRTGEPRVDDAGEPVMVPLEVRRTRKLHYKSPGTNQRPQAMRAEVIDETDVMR